MPQNFGVEIKGLRQLSYKLSDLSSGFGSRKLMSEIGFFLAFKIKQRTAEGKDVDGSPFVPYSPAYRLFRKKKGHPVGKVSLFFTGSMLSSMTQTASKNKVRLYFANTEDDSGGKNPLKAYFLNQRREFFAMSNGDVNDLVDMVEESIEDQLESP